jgi:Flp pilus assembly protein TadD
MVINRALGVWLLLLCASAGAREAASPASCQLAASQPPIANAKAALDRNSADLSARFKLADAWSDAGCFNESLQVLQSGRELHPESKELETRLRVARSLVGEETYFDNLDRANEDAKLKRDTFRCTKLADVEACAEALRIKPDDPAVLAGQGDALVRAQHPAEAVALYRRAAALAPGSSEITSKLGAAEAQLPPSRSAGQTVAGAGHSAGAPAARVRPPAPAKAADARVARMDGGDAGASTRRYSNADPVGRSH